MNEMIKFSGMVKQYNGEFKNTCISTYDKVENAYPDKYNKNLNNCLVFGKDLPKASGLKVVVTCDLVKGKSGKQHLTCNDWHFLWPTSIKNIRALFIETLVNTSLISTDKLDNLLKTHENDFMKAFKDVNLTSLVSVFCPKGSNEKFVNEMKNSLNKLNKIYNYDLDLRCERSGISKATVSTILNHYRIDRLDKLNNPYDCMSTCGLSFDMCGRIARIIGKKDINGCILACTKNILANMGEKSKHLYFDYESIGIKVIKKINDGVTFEMFDKVIENNVKKEESPFYVSNYEGKKIIMFKKDMQNEVDAARKLNSLINNTNSARVNEEISALVANLNNHGYTFTSEQLEAIKTSLQNRVSIITGGPGTGKTTVIKGIIDVYRTISSLPITCMAPTGKAASRMREETGIEASTIHSAIKMIPGEESELKRIDRGLVIVDECSMIDQDTFTKMLKMISNGSTLILLGDVNQLPSVGRGNVLNELIKSNMIMTSTLTAVKRQEETSSIIENSNRILDENDDLLFDENCHLLNMKDNDTDKLVKLYLDNVKKYGEDDVMALCPLRNEGARKFKMVSSKLNLLLRDAINPLKEGLDTIKVATKDGEIAFRAGDRVMSWKNMDDVLNGDIGKIVKIEHDAAFINWENGVSCAYNKEEMSNLTLAYSMSVHKSQGSEYKCVIMPFLSAQNCALFNRNLIYTGLTRAKQECIFVGDDMAISKAIKTYDTSVRNSLLSYRVKTNMM